MLNPSISCMLSDQRQNRPAVAMCLQDADTVFYYASIRRAPDTMHPALRMGGLYRGNFAQRVAALLQPRPPVSCFQRDPRLQCRWSRESRRFVCWKFLRRRERDAYAASERPETRMIPRDRVDSTGFYRSPAKAPKVFLSTQTPSAIAYGAAHTITFTTNSWP